MTAVLRQSIPIILGFLFACAAAVARNEGLLKAGEPVFYAQCAMFALFFCVLFNAADRLLFRPDPKTRAAAPGDGTAIASVSRKFPLEWHAKDTAAAWLLIVVCWTPYFAVSFPGIIWHDSIQQVSNGLTGQLSDHHPFALTCVLAVFARLGIAISGNVSIGLFILIALQGMFAAFAFALSVTYASTWNVRYATRFALLLFYALFPVFPLMFSSLVKETIFAPLFLCCCVIFVELCRHSMEHKAAARAMHAKTPHATAGIAPSAARFCRLIVALLPLCIIASMVKKTGAMIIVLTCFAIALTVRGIVRKIVVAATGVLTIVVVSVAIPAVLFPVLHVSPGGSQEILAVPMQQVALVRKIDGQSLSADDLKVIDDNYLKPDTIAEDYTWWVADPVKGYAPAENANTSNFLKLWAKQGIHHPSLYLAAWSGLSEGWFAFDGTQNPTLSVAPEQENLSDPGAVETIRAFGVWQDRTVGRDSLAVLNDSLGSLPLARLAYLKSTWASVLPAFALFMAFRARRERRLTAIALLAPVLFTCLSIYAGPVSTELNGVRYVFPLVCVVLFQMTIARTLLERDRGVSAPAIYLNAS